MQAKDIMTRDVVTVGPEAEAAEVARLMLERCVSAIPVVDGKRRILGIVSEVTSSGAPSVGPIGAAAGGLRCSPTGRRSSSRPTVRAPRIS